MWRRTTRFQSTPPLLAEPSRVMARAQKRRADVSTSAAQS
jgi:hypothetical protein